MIKLLKQIKESPPEPQQIVAWGTCEWGEDHYFELKRTDEWIIDEPTYKLYLGYEPDNFAIELTGTIDDLITTIDAMGNMPARKGEENE